MVVADAHVGYFRNRSFEDRLRADVMVPARARGYESIWLAGISLGGLGALLYADEHPEEVAGLLLIVLLVQIGLGLSNVAFGLPLAVAVGHNDGGAALLLSLVLVNYHARTSLVRVRNQLPFGWRFIPRKHVSGLITLKGEMPWRP